MDGLTFVRSKPAALITAALMAVGGLGVAYNAPVAEAVVTSSVQVRDTQYSTYVDKSNPKTNYSTATRLKIGANNRYFTYVSYPKIALAANQTITAATLTITPISGTVDYATGVVAQPVTAGWTGKALTYNTQPAVSANLNSPVLTRVNSPATITLGSAAFSKISSGTGLALKLYHTKGSPAFDLGKKASDGPELKVTIATTTPDPTPTPTPTPSSTTPAVADRLVFAHYHPQFPISLDDAYTPVDRDYYTTQYLSADGEGGKHKSYDGFLRDRPLPEIKRDASVDRIAENFKQEINDAKAAGIDGFAVDQWSFTETYLGEDGITRVDQYYARLKGLAAAAKAVGGFKIMLQPDVGSGDSVTEAKIAASFVNLTNTYGTSNTGGVIYSDNAGRVIVSPFRAEAKGATFWANVLTEMNKLRVTGVLWPLFVDPRAAKTDQAAWNAISIGFADWGGRETMNGTTDGTWSNSDWAAANSKMWMQSVAVQDARYYTWKDESGVEHSNMYQEAGNSEALRNNWSWAMGKTGYPAANMVMLVTWNDYSESTSFAPSVDSKYAILDLNKYFLNQYKSKASSVSTATEAVFVSHRKQKYSYKSTCAFPSVLRTNGNKVAARDTVEVVSIVKTATQIKVSLGSSGTQTYDVAAGLTAKTFPLPTSGVISVQYLRNGTVLGTATTTSPVLAAPTKQDLTYLFASSLR